MRIAIVGTGISGLTAAYLLSKKHSVTVFEAAPEIGGHTATKTVSVGGQSYAVDTGFIVYNDWTYPNFIKLLERLNVETKPTEMGFSVFKPDGSFYYAGNNLSTLFAKRSLLLNGDHWRTLRDILRFHREAVTDWRNGLLNDGITLGEYLSQHNYSAAFKDHYLIPMGAAIWSSSCDDMQHFPAKFFVEFFHNHGLLSINNRPTWRVVEGGSKQYLEPLTAAFADAIHCNESVSSVERKDAEVHITTAKAEYRFDHVVMATHSDQALAALRDATEHERQVLGAIAYRENSVVLHTDTALLPPHRRAWASWNYCLTPNKTEPPLLTYNMNILQGLTSDTTFCVSLNAGDRIRQDAILGEYRYAHPVFNLDALSAQNQWQKIFSNSTSYCGAYWFNGFHEDGVNSAIRVAAHLGVEF